MYKIYFFGSIAQLVEQGTENPRVSGSIPLRATKKDSKKITISFFIFSTNNNLLLVGLHSYSVQNLLDYNVLILYIKK